MRAINSVILAVWLLSGGGYAAAETGAADCRPLDGWEAVAGRGRGGVVVFGETHGTREGPAAVAEFVCAISKGTVLLAVELSSRRNPELQAAWSATNDEAFASGVLEAFEGRVDGVGSQAMYSMLKRVHDLRLAGADIDIVAFNGARDDAQRDRFRHLPAQGPHEAAQTENIREAAMRRQYAYVVVLVGSLHAQKRLASGQAGEFFAPMAMQLAEDLPVVSLVMRQAGGTAWTCILKTSNIVVGASVTAADIECGPHSNGTFGIQVPASPRFWLRNTGGESASDGGYFVGETSASAPFELLQTPAASPQPESDG